MAKSVLNAARFQNEEAAFAHGKAHLQPNGPVRWFRAEPGNATFGVIMSGRDEARRRWI